MMGRQRNREHRQHLRARAAEYLLRVGISAADLGELAAELGTSSRMLVHYFGSKDKLIDEAIGEAREQQRALFREWFQARHPRTLTNVLRTLWELMRTPQAEPYLRLFSEAYTVAIQQPGRFSDFSTYAAVHDWLPGLETALREGGADDDAQALATLVLAVERGLQLDVLGTGEHERVRAAHDALLRLLDSTSGRR
jgi:AcrR family transcriptional regulator